MRDASKRDAKSKKNGDRSLRFQSLCMAFSITRKGDDLHHAALLTVTN